MGNTINTTIDYVIFILFPIKKNTLPLCRDEIYPYFTVFFIKKYSLNNLEIIFAPILQYFSHDLFFISSFSLFWYALACILFFSFYLFIFCFSLSIVSTYPSHVLFSYPYVFFTYPIIFYSQIKVKYGMIFYL